MAKQWSATSFAAIALICCLAGKDVEAQYKPQNPQVQANPQNPQVLPKPPYPQVQPNPQNPLTSKLSYDQAVRTPQNPQAQANPQNPYNVSPPQPQNPLNTKLSYDQAVKNPQNPQVHYDQSYQTPQISSQKRYQQNPVIIPVKTCDVERNVRVPCGVPGISATECEAIDCCHDGQQCFFGRTGKCLKRLLVSLKTHFFSQHNILTNSNVHSKPQ